MGGSEVERVDTRCTRAENCMYVHNTCNQTQGRKEGGEEGDMEGGKGEGVKGEGRGG